MSRLSMKDGRIVIGEQDEKPKNTTQKTNTSNSRLSMVDGRIVLADKPAANAANNQQYLQKTRAAQQQYQAMDDVLPQRRTNVMDMAIDSLLNRVANSTIGRAANEWASRVSGNIQNVLNESPEYRAAKRQARAENEARRQQFAIDTANLIDQASAQYEGPTKTETVRGKFTDTEGADMFSNDWEPGDAKEIEYTRTVRNENYNPLSREDRDALISKYADAMNGRTDANGYQQVLYDVTKNGGIEQLYREQQADAANDREYGRQLRGVDLDAMNFWQRLGGTLGGTVAGAGEQIASSGVGLAVSGLNREAGIATQEFGPALEQTARRWFYALANGAEDDPAVEEQIRTLASYVGVDADTLVSRVKDRAEQARNSDEDQAVFAYGLLDGLEADQDKIWENAQQAIADAGFYDTINNLQQKSAEHIQYAKDVNLIQNQFGDNLVEAGVSTIQNAADAAMAATLGLSGTGIVAMIPFALRAYGGTYAEQMQQATELGGLIGQDVAKKAAKTAGLSSAIEVGTEMMWGMVGAMSKVTGGGALDDAAQQRLTEILSGWAKTETGRKILTTVGEKALGGITEGLEEVIGDAAEQILKNVGIMPGEAEEWSDWVKNAGHSFITGALGGLLGEFTSVVSSPMQQSQIGKQLKAGGLDISLNELADLANSEGMENTSLAKAYSDVFSGMPRNIENISDLEAGKLYTAYEEMLGKRSDALDRIEQMQAKVEAGETLTRADVNRITNNSDAVSILAESGAVSEDAFGGGINERRDAVEMALRAFANDSTALSNAQAENVQAEKENANTAVSAPNPFLAMSNSAIDNIVRNAQPMSPAQSIRESNTGNVLAGNVLRSAARVVDAAERLNVSERGQDVMARMYSPNMDAIDYVGQMTKYYNQGKENKELNFEEIAGNNLANDQQSLAAWRAGRADYLADTARREINNEGTEGQAVLLRDGTERMDGENSVRESAAMGEVTGGAEVGQTGFQQRSAGAERVYSGSKVGARLTENQLNARDIAAAGYNVVTGNNDVEANNVKNYVTTRARKNGINVRDVILFRGAMLDVNGAIERGFFIYHPDGSVTIAAQLDNEDATGEQIATHEFTHALIKKMSVDLGKATKDVIGDLGESGEVSFGTIRDYMAKELGGQDRLIQAVNAYAAVYKAAGAIQADENGNVSTEDMRMVFEEMICDFVAGMNAFAEVGHVSTAVRSAPVMAAAKKAVEKLANETRGSPSPEAYLPRTQSEQRSRYDGNSDMYAIDPNGRKYSLGSLRNDIIDSKFQNDLINKLGMKPADVNKLVASLNDLMEYIKPNRDILDLNETYTKENRPYSPYKPNSDPLYKISLDYSTLCRKRLMTQYIIEKLQLREHRPMSGEEQIAIRDMLKEYRQIESGLQVACAMCYVEAARLKSPDQMNRYFEDPTPVLKNYFAQKNKAYKRKVENLQKKWKTDHGYDANATKKEMTPADVAAFNEYSSKIRHDYDPATDQADAKRRKEEIDAIERAKTLSPDNYLSAANLADLKEKDQLIYDAYTSNIRAATRSKGLETDVPYYYGDSRKKGGPSDKFIKNVNAENGMRFSSWSDFQFVHLLDQMMATIDLSVRKAAMHGYTKFPEQVRIFGKTGAMFNMSGVSGGTGFNADGSLYFSPTESIDFEEAKRLREEFPETAGLQCIGINDKHVRALLQSDFIDYVIPYHVSGMNAALRNMAKISSWKDYTSTQEESVIDSKATWEESGKKCAKEKWHKAPVFSEFFDPAWYADPAYKGKGVEAMREAKKRYIQMCADRGMRPKFPQFLNEANYWKLLIDRKMVNQKTGDLIQQKPVTPNFDFDVIKKEIDTYVANTRATQGIEDRALKYITDRWDQLPGRIAALKQEGAVEKTIAEVEHRANTLGSEMYATAPKNVAAYKFSPVLYHNFSEEELKNNASQLRTMPVVSQLTGEEFTKSTEKLLDKVDSFFKKYNNNVYNELLGDVALSRTSIRSDIRHGLTHEKAIAFAAVPDVIRDGVAVDFIDKGNRRERIIMAAPITIGPDKYYEAVMLQRDPQSQRLYAHDVVTEKESNMDLPEHLNTTGLTNASDGLYITDILLKALHVKKNYEAVDQKPVKQEISSADTSLNQVPALHKDSRVEWGETNIDIGAGAYEAATDYLKEKGVTNLKWDPYNQPEEVNRDTLKYLQDGNKADTATNANVLNVIAEKDARLNVVLQAAKSIKPDGKAYFMVYEGDGSGIGRKTSKGWQNNLKTREYADEIRTYFNDVQVKGKLIVASDPKENLPMASWEVTPGNAIRFSRNLAPTFYSKLEREIENFKGDKIGADSAVKYLKGKGVKDEDIKWSGINTFLEGKKSVSKTEILEYLRANRLTVNENVLDGSGPEGPYIKGDKYFNGEEFSVEDYKNALRKKAKELGGKLTFFDENNGYVGYTIKLDNGGMISSSDRILYRKQGAQPNWSGYKAPGGRNYREILYTLPGSTYTNAAMKTHWKGIPGVIAHARIQDFETGAGKILFVDEIQSDWHNEGAKKSYATEADLQKAKSIKKELNRIDEEMKKIQINRIKYMGPLEKVLQPAFEAFDPVSRSHSLLMSIAADYVVHKKTAEQLASEYYYDLDKVERFLSSIPSEAYEIIRRGESFEEQIDKLSIEYGQAYRSLQMIEDAVPDAPFRNGTYIQYVLKDLLRKATEGGYDYLAWTTGKMQEDRWSSTYAEGYRIEYDQDIPKFLSKYGKQWGAKLSEIPLVEGREEYEEYKKYFDEYYNILHDYDRDYSYDDLVSSLGNFSRFDPEEAGLSTYESGRIRVLSELLDNAYENGIIDEDNLYDNVPSVVPAIPITDAMRESVLYEGQPMFSRDLSNTELYDANRQLQKDLTELRSKLKTRTEQYKYWKGQTKVTEGRQLRIEDVTKLAREIIKGQESSADAKAVAEKMKALGEYLLNSQDENVYDEARLKAYEVAHDILANAKTLNTKGGDDFYSDFRTALKNQPIYVAPSVREEVAPDGWNEFRKAQYGTVNMTADQSKGKSVDTVYHDLQSTFGEWLLPEYIVSEADQLNRILEVIETYRPVYENLNSYEMADAVEWTANEILTRIIGEEIRETNPTYADRMEKKLADQKAKAQTALKQVRQQRDRKVADLKAHYQQVAEDRRNRKIDSEMRSRLLKIAKRLNNKKLDRVTRGLLDQYIGELDLVSKGILGRTVKELETLQAWYDSYRESMGEDFIPDKFIERKIARLSKKHISDLTQEEVADLTTVLLNIENTIRTQNQLIESQIKMDAYAAGVQTIDDINNSNGRTGFLNKFISTETATPEREIHRITGYRDSSPLYKAAKELSDGQRKMLDYQMRAEALFKKWTTEKKFIRRIAGKNAEEITVSGYVNGQLTDVKITPAMRMALYLHEKNDDNMRHISKGGVKIPDMALYKKGKLQEAYDKATRVVFTRGMLKEIASKMSADEKAFADAVDRYYNGMSRNEINDTSEALRGYAIAGVEHYYPIDTDGSFLKKEFDAIKRDGSIEGMGILKERIEGATNPIMLYDMNDTLNRSISQHSKYTGLAIPVRNFNKLYGVTTHNYETSVAETLKKNWGSAATSYIEKMMADVQNGTGLKSDAWGDLLARARSKYAGAVLNTNASVAMKQAASYPTAAAVVGYGPLMKALADVKKIDLDKLAQYTPLLWYRSKGFSTTELGDIGKEGRHIPKALNWIQAMDVATTTKLAKSAMYYVNENNKDLTRGTDAWWKAVAEVYNRIIEETQPNYTMMQRPQILRSDNALTRALNMFKTQPFQNFNILYDAFGNLAAKSREYKVNATEENLQALKSARTNVARAVSSQAVSAFVFALMQFAWDAFRGKTKKYKDDDDEMTLASWLKGMGINVLSSAGGMIPFGSYALELGETMTDAILKAFKLDPFFNQTFYGLSENAAESVNDMGNAMINMVTKTAQALSGSEVTESTVRSVVDSMGDIAQFAGIPINNVIKLAQAIGRNYYLATEGKYVGGYYALRVTTDPSKYKSDYYDLLWKAYNNDKAAYNEIIQMMLDDGFEESKIKDAMEERMKDAQGVSHVDDLDSRWMAPAQQKIYDEGLADIENTTMFQAATDEQQKKVLTKLYNIALENANGKTLDEKIEGGADVGLDQTEYLLYSLALSMTNPEGGTPTNGEVEAAILMVPGLSKEERAYLWDAAGKAAKSNPWR